MRVPGQAPNVSPLESGPTGRAVFSISLDDPSIGTAGRVTEYNGRVTEYNLATLPF